MCVSLIVENELEALAATLGLSHIGIVGGDVDASTRRVEARAPSLVLRLGAGGRIVAEAMTFNPYVVRRSNVNGDLWAHSLLGESHGLIVIRSFSEWASGMRLLRSGLANIFEVNCAFNRFANPAPVESFQNEGHRDRLVLANFTPAHNGRLLVPVLFDVSRRADGPTKREFAIITHEPPIEVARTGAGHSPVSLSIEAALEWLHAPQASEPADSQEGPEEDPDFQALLEDVRDEEYDFALFKSA